MPETQEDSSAAERGSGARTLAILRHVADLGGAFSLSTLASRAGLPASSVHRLLQPLLQAGFVERSDAQFYRPGREFMRIAALVLREIDVRGVAKPLLRQLWTEWQETCSLCLYRPATHSAMVAEIIHTPKPLRFVLEPFVELSLTWGSLGRAILAFLPEEEAALAIERGQVGPLSGLPSPSGAELAEALAQVRELGFAHYRNDAFDVAGVAAPVYRADALVIGSIGLTLPSQRLQADRIGAMARAVGDVAARLSTALGYSR